jgi:hypothetical protein
MKHLKIPKLDLLTETRLQVQEKAGKKLHPLDDDDEQIDVLTWKMLDIRGNLRVATRHYTQRGRMMTPRADSKSIIIQHIEQIIES